MIRKFPIIVNNNAWTKIKQILNNTNNKYGMLFSANSGGCNGFNYELKLLDKKMTKTLENQNANFLENEKNKIYIDPIVEMYLIGTTIDFLQEDYSKNIYENKFVFIPDKNLASTCGCGTSFSPKI